MFIAAFAFFLFIKQSSSFQLVTSEGAIKSSTQISDFVTEKVSQSGSECHVLSFINCGSPDSLALAQKILSIDVDSISNGISVRQTDSLLALLPRYEAMFAAPFCGAKAIDYCSSVSCSVFITLPLKDLEENLNGHDQVFRRLLWKMYLQKKKLNLYVVVDNTSTISTDNSSELLSLINGRIEDISKEVIQEFPESKDSDLLNLNTRVLDTNNDAAVAQLLSDIKSETVSSRVDTLPTQFTEAWSSLPTIVPKPILTPAQRSSLFHVEAAYAAGLTQSESLLNQWRHRINSGRTILKFGERASKLIEDILNTYYERTSGTLVVRERAERAQALQQSIKRAINALFLQQLEILENEVNVEFKQDLLKLVRQKPDEFNVESQQVIRDTVYRFKSRMSELENTDLNLEASTMLQDLTTSLQDIAKDFLETPAARLETLRSLDKRVRKPKKKKGKRAINFAINLVGMLRPPGYGNLQGFVGYNGLSLFGIPIDTLLGVQNDGDAPEIIGEDREHPLLRLQPKVHFDVDL